MEINKESGKPELKSLLKKKTYKKKLKCLSLFLFSFLNLVSNSLSCTTIKVSTFFKHIAVVSGIL